VRGGALCGVPLPFGRRCRVPDNQCCPGAEADTYKREDPLINGEAISDTARLSQHKQYSDARALPGRRPGRSVGSSQRVPKGM
jgi:hypothetical protein